MRRIRGQRFRLTRFTMGKITTAVAAAGERGKTYCPSKAPTATRVSPVAADNVGGVVQKRVIEPERGEREDERAEEPGTHDVSGPLLRHGRRVQTMAGSAASRGIDGRLASCLVVLCTHHGPPSLADGRDDFAGSGRDVSPA